MVAVALPSTPPPAGMSIAKVSAANVLTSAMQGSDSEIDRKGERYALTFTMPSMSYVESMAWSVLGRKGITVVMEVQQPGLDVGEPGLPRVKTAGQQGVFLLIDGLAVGYTLRVGQFLSLIVAGQRYLHRVAAQVAAGGDGSALVELQEMLRVSPPDNAVVEIVDPKVEGYARDVGEVSVGIDRRVGIQFTVRERE
jgi:hypothetical protein